jgi:outer membrane lipoprotein-sorting protein
MKKLLFILVGLFIFSSCKTKKVITDGTLDNTLSAKSIIKNHYQNELDFKTIVGRMKIDYSDGESSQGVTVSFRMEKDKAIWMSATLSLVKVYITPERVTFYNKLEKEYFDGNFSYLSYLLGAELDFEKVQNLLLGQAIFDLKEGKYNLSETDGTYQLKPKKEHELFKILFEIEPKNYRMAVQQLSQPLKKRLLQVKYKNYQNISSYVVPNIVLITAIDQETQNTIDIEYRNIEFNRQLSFPYKIPKGYKEIILE